MGLMKMSDDNKELIPPSIGTGDPRFISTPTLMAMHTLMLR
jgi:hypothetical protein